MSFAIAHCVCSTQRFIGGRGKEGEGPKNKQVSLSRAIQWQHWIDFEKGFPILPICRQEANHFEAEHMVQQEAELLRTVVFWYGWKPIFFGGKWGWGVQKREATPNNRHRFLFCFLSPEGLRRFLTDPTCQYAEELITRNSLGTTSDKG